MSVLKVGDRVIIKPENKPKSMKSDLLTITSVMENPDGFPYLYEVTYDSKWFWAMPAKFFLGKDHIR